ncbi:MAG: TrkH family potassium uptake protein [Thermoplasmatota archaeon]
MRKMRVLAAVGQIIRIFGVTFLIPFLAALAYEPWDMTLGFIRMPANGWLFLGMFILCAWIAYPIHWITRQYADDDLQDKEAYLTVGIGWMVLTVIAMLPFIGSGVLTNPADAFFEAMSGFTTTGASVIDTPLEEVPKSVMLWRALLQYIGGMGIIVLSVAVLARLTHGGIQLLQAEAPGPSVTRIRPKLAQTAKTLWGVYAIFSAVLFIILFLIFRLDVGLSPGDAFYDAIIHTFTTISTGGFSNHSASIAFFDSWIVEAVLILFMLVAGSNFTLHYHVLQGDWKRMVRDSEWRSFLVMFAIITALLTAIVFASGESFLEAFRGAGFITASIGTSAGFGTVDYDAWPDGAKLLIVLLMFTGATAGSTAGGMKVIRIMLLMKVVKRELRKLLHPRAVIPIRMGHKVIKEETVMTVIAFFFSFITIWLVGTAILISTDPVLGLVDGAVTAASAMGNTGPGMGVVGPTDNMSALLPSSKLLLSGMMWIGRLEVFTALILFSPASWKN